MQSQMNDAARRRLGYLPPISSDSGTLNTTAVARTSSTSLWEVSACPFRMMAGLLLLLFALACASTAAEPTQPGGDQLRPKSQLELRQPRGLVAVPVDVPATATEIEVADLEFTSFSAAFTDALRAIHETHARQHPQPAGRASEPNRVTRPSDSRQEEASRPSAQDRNAAATGKVEATEVIADDAQREPMADRWLPDPMPLAPSVAGIPDPGNAPPKTVTLPDQIERFFERSEQETMSESGKTEEPVVTATEEANSISELQAADDRRPDVANSAPVATPKESSQPPTGQEPASLSTRVASIDRHRSDPVMRRQTDDTAEPRLPADRDVLLPPAPQPRAEKNTPITAQLANLQPRLAKTLRYYFDRPLNTHDDSPWSVMHSMLGYGHNGMVAINGQRGTKANVVQWLCQNGLCANRRLLFIKDGYIEGVEGPGFQGHPGQYLAMLAQIGVPRDFPLRLQGRNLTLDALIRSEMHSCSSTRELTFKLISLSHYLETDETWKSENGEVWDVPTMLSKEIQLPINGAACGGTHRLLAISSAVKMRWLRGEPIDGPYEQASHYVRQYQKYTLSLQNRDGSFSTDWFKRRANSRDRDRLLQTTGHMLEWLVFSLPREELADPRVVAAVEFLNGHMTRHRYHDWEVGPRGHAIRALSLYHQRVFERKTIPNPRLPDPSVDSP